VDLPKVMSATREFSFFFFTLVTGPRRSLSLKLSDARVYAPQIRARLGTTTHFWTWTVVPKAMSATREFSGMRQHRGKS